MATLEETVTEIADRFRRAELVFGHGTDNAWDEAVALVLGVTGLADDRAQARQPLAADQCNQIQALAELRINDRQPLPYLLGKVRYAGRDFICQPGVVIPRSPLSALIEAGFRPWLRRQPGAIVDVCCGTGALGILCAYAFPDASITLLDLDPNALALAARNVAAHGLVDRVRVQASDLLDAVQSASFDVVVSNPPYVDAVDLATLPAEYRHEPAVGLAGGNDGLEIVTRLMRHAAACLPGDGLFVCEVGGSAAMLHRRFPTVAFTWPDLPAGGEGVFVLEGHELHDAGVFGQHA